MITVPAALAAAKARFDGEAGRAWVAGLPRLAERMLRRWDLTLAPGPARHGVAALVLPVTRADGGPAVLKLQQPDHETVGEGPALRAWHGEGAVRLLAHDEASGSLLLEALDPDRSLDGVPDVEAALTVLAGVLRRLVAAEPPPGLRRLAGITARMLDEAPRLAPRAADPDERRLLADCAAAVREVAHEPGGALLHWDLHYQNVLAPTPAARAAGREPWLAIDPKPLVGDPGFELLPALVNRFDAGGVLRRFDLMTSVLGLERARAARWTLGRVLQNALWLLRDGAPGVGPEQVAIARAVRARC